MKPREKGEGEGEVKSWNGRDGRMTSEALLSEPYSQLLGQVAGRGCRPCFCCLQVPAPGSTSVVVPRSLDIGERSLLGLLAMCLPPIPTHNLQPNTGETEWVASWDGPTGWSFLLPQQLVAVSHSTKRATQWLQGEALHLSACSGRLCLCPKHHA